MLNGNLENKGIYGYSKSKDKKNIDAILNGSDVIETEKPNAFQPAKELVDVGNTVNRIENYNNLLSNKDERSTYHYNVARDALVPRDTEERRRRNFVLSRNVADDAVNDFYKKSVRPQFLQQRTDAENAAVSSYKKSVGVLGAHPFYSLGQARKEVDPSKVINTTMEKLDNEQLNKLADAYARYGGLDTKSYRDAVLKPSIENRLYNEYVKENIPKSSLEYITRSAYNNSLIGKAANLSLDGYSQTDSHRNIENEAMLKYGGNRAENFAAGVGSLLLDTGVFAGIGGVASKLTGKATSAISNTLTSRVMAKGASRGLSEDVARRIVDRTFINNIGTRIASSGTAQGLTLGAYDATNSVADDLLYGDGIDAGKAAGSFAKGFGTGMMLGAVGTPLRQKALGLTGGKKMAASAGVLSAESAVFTLGTEIDKYANDIDIEPIDLLYDFGESAATLLTMRMSHWRPKGYREKLNSDGRLKPELNFNSVERQEILNAGVNPEKFISSMEQELHPRYPSLHGNARRDFIRNYEGLMSNEELSASTRAKLLYIVENKLTSTPPVPVDCDIEISDGTTLVNVKDNAGRNVQRLAFDSRAEADAFVEKNSGHFRRNRIATIEEMFQRGVDSENFFRQAGEYAKETGISVDKISNAMYKKAKHKSLNSSEMQIIDDIMSRSSYNDVELGNVMHDIRRNIEQRYGLNKGALLSAVEKNSSECTVSENRALSDYESVIRREAELLRSGVSPEMRENARNLIDKQGFGEYDDEHIRRYEREYDNSVKARPLRGNPNIKDSYKSLHPKEYADALENGFSYPEDGQPPVLPYDAKNPTKGYMYSHDDLARMAVNARDIAKRFNADIELIYDPHQLDSSHGEYGYQTMAKGWYDMGNDKIVLNLANNKSLEDVKFTLLHEIVGHRGLYKLFGDSYTKFLREVYKRASSDIADEFKISTFENESDRYDKIDEYLASIAEKSYKSPEERGILNSFGNFLGDAMYRMGLPMIRDLNEKKISMILSKHRDAMEGGMSPRKHRRKVFGSFNSSHLSDEAYGVPKDGDFPKYRYRFIGQKGFENLKKARKKLSSNSNDGMSPVFHYYDMDGSNYSAILNNNKIVDESSLRRAKNYHELNKANYYKVPQEHRFRYIGDEWLKNSLLHGNRDLYEDYYKSAEKLHESDFSSRYIKKQTGWELGADGKWRYEIDDRYINVNHYPLMRMKTEYPDLYNVFDDVREGRLDVDKEPWIQDKLDEFHFKLMDLLKEQPKLSEVISDKLFFDAYPKFRNVRVVYDDDFRRDPCYYDKEKNIFYINSMMLGDEDLNLYAAAEMQRMIQDYEGFSKAYPMHEVLPSNIYKEANKPIKEAEFLDFASGFQINEPRDFYASREKYRRKYGFFPKDIPQDNSAREDIILSFVNNGEAAQSGNVETRNVMNRFYFDKNSRRENLAEDTEDIYRGNQISPKSISDLRKFLKGPIDIIRDAGYKIWGKKNSDNLN